MSIAAGSPFVTHLFSDLGVVWAALFLITAAVLAAVLGRSRGVQARCEDLQDRVDFSARRRRMAMELFHTLGSAFESEVRVEDLLRHILRFFMRIVQASGGCAFLVDPDAGVVIPKVTTGRFLSPDLSRDSAKQKLHEHSIRIGEGVIGAVAKTGRSRLVQDARSDPGFSLCADQGLEIRNAIAVPLRFRKKVLGVILVVNRVDDPSRPGESFGRFEFQLLESLSTYAAVAIHLVLSYLAQTEKQRLDFDLSVASEIQRLLLPQAAPVVDGYSISGASRPAHRVGGDYFDFLRLDEARLGVAIADVSGKGVTGALVMGICRSIVRTQVAAQPSPAAALLGVRQWLLSDLPEDMFVTMTYGVLDRNSGSFRFARAGHDPLLRFVAAEKRIEVLAPKGSALGFSRGLSSPPPLDELELPLAPGDMVILFTDGITEAMNEAGEEFGRDALENIIVDNASRTAQEISTAILEAVLKFSGNEPAYDDQTLIVLKRTDHQPNPGHA